jgi:ABC-type transport system involved in cytochrome c biogenesis ATPase subunit
MNIIEIENYWQGVDFARPQTKLKAEGHPIENLQAFVQSHIAFLKHNAGVRGYLPYFERLHSVTLAHMKVKT